MNMKGILSNVALFAVGTVVGAVVTKQYFKTKYEQLANEEIESVRATFAKIEEIEENEEDEQKPIGKTKGQIDKERLDKIINDMGYSSESDDDIINKKEETDMMDPYVIAPEEFDEGDYDTVSLTYYEDGVLEDEQGNIIENPEDLVGEDFATHFGEYEDDSVFIRNEDMGTEYEILRVERTYY